MQYQYIPCPEDKIKIKCPFKMKPGRIVIHNTANDASARDEISYMHRNRREVSFHFAVDDKEVIQGIDLGRNAWHAGDGHGKGNMTGIAIEICYSKSGGEKFEKAQKNAAKLTAELLKKYGWSLNKVTKHQDYGGKYCPHRTLLEYGWDYFLNAVECELKGKNQPDNLPPKTESDIVNEVIAGFWGNGAERKNRLTAAGYDYGRIQSAVNKLFRNKNTVSVRKSDYQIALEVIKGNWGNGSERKQRLIAAGYNYSIIQSTVNRILKQGASI